MKRLTLYIATVNQTGTLDKGHYIAYVKLIDCRCDSLTYNPNHPALYLIFGPVRGLGYLSLSLGVTTMHITLVLLLYMSTILLD